MGRTSGMDQTPEEHKGRGLFEDYFLHQEDNAMFIDPHVRKMQMQIRRDLKIVK